MDHILEDATGKHITIMEENTHKNKQYTNNQDPKAKPHDTIANTNQAKTTKHTEETRTDPLARYTYNYKKQKTKKGTTKL